MALTHCNPVDMWMLEFLHVFPEQRSLAQCNHELFQLVTGKSFGWDSCCLEYYLCQKLCAQFERGVHVYNLNWEGLFRKFCVSTPSFQNGVQKTINETKIDRNRFIDIFRAVAFSEKVFNILIKVLSKPQTAEQTSYVLDFRSDQFSKLEVFFCSSYGQKKWKQHKMQLQRSFKSRFIFALSYGQAKLLKYYGAIWTDLFKDAVNIMPQLPRYLVRRYRPRGRCMPSRIKSIFRNQNKEVPLTLVLQSHFSEQIQTEIVQYICSFNVNVNLTNQQQNTPLMLACQMQSCESIVTVLYQSGADINMKNMLGETALHQALRHHRYENTKKFNLIRFLIVHGALLNVQTFNDKTTPLMIAAKHGDLLTMWYLIKFGASVDAVNKWGETAPMFAEYYFNDAFYKDLLLLWHSNHHKSLTM